MTRLYTIGHGALEEAHFLRLLAGAAVAHVVDVRIVPGSRFHPQFRRELLRGALEKAGVDYRWEKRLGGRRVPREDSPHRALADPAFRGYADHMESASFRDALEQLLLEAGERPTAILCAERDWRRCHRSMIADAAVLLHRASVIHLGDDGSREVHRPHVAARRDGARLCYDRGVEPPLFPAE